MSEDRPYISYPFTSPRMDQSTPPNQVRVGSFGRLAGVDGRFNGCLHKYYGNKKILDLDDPNVVTGMGNIDAHDGPSYIKQVTFQKRNTSTVYRGFVIRWDKQNDNTDEQVDLVYTANYGDTWSVLEIWASGVTPIPNGIASSLEIDCVVDRGYLLIAVDTKATKTVYWNGAALVEVSSGPGSFDTELGAMTFKTSEVKTDYHLNGSGTYQVAYRFYDSTRGIYSALSAPLTVHLDHLKTTKATGTISLSSAGGNLGLMIEGDVITINGRTYGYISGDSDVIIGVASVETTSAHAQALADAINGDGDDLAVVTASAQATSVLLESKVRGTGGNAYTLTKTEVAPHQTDIVLSGATLSGGGVVTTETETQVKAVIEFPLNTAVVSDEVYADFDALFDKLDIFRTIDLGNINTTQGAIFYLEQTIDKSEKWATSETWDSLQVTIGTVIDSALPALTHYDPEKDIIAAPPKSGTIGRYENQTYMAQTATVNGGYDTLWSSPEHASAEYFSTYNKRVGDPEDGRPLKFLPAGDSLFQLCYNAIMHIFKSGKLRPIQISRLHQKRGILGKEAAHSSGNSIFMLTGLGVSILNGKDGSIGGVSAADRVIFIDWKSELSDVKSGYDALLNASFFLNTTREEMLILWHSTKTCSMLDGANFVGVTSGPDISGGKNDRVFFITKTGLIVSPDNLELGSGTMWDINSSYTLNGTVTVGGTSVTDSSAILNDDMVGSKLYFTTGSNAGIGRTIASVDNSEYNELEGTGKEITFSAEFPATIAVGDTYAVSPVPFSLRAWPVQAEQVSRFNRWNTVGVSIKSRKLGSGFDSNVNNKWRVGAYRNSGTSLESSTAYPEVSPNPSTSAEALNIEGVDIELYIEQIASGVSFELTDAEIALALSDSRKVTT